MSHLNEVGSDEHGDALPGHQPKGAHQVEEEQVEAKACLKVESNLRKRSKESAKETLKLRKEPFAFTVTK